MDQDQNRHHPHDKGYKYLLSSKKTFMELVRSFIRRHWVRYIDENHLVQLDKSYILPDFSEKEADLVYQVKLQEHDVIFYILLELQSTVDYQMPFRLLLYQIEIWRDVLKNTEQREAARKAFRLPAIVPIVLYNGKHPWTAKQRFRDTLSGHHLFGDELLNFQYFLIDVHRYTEDELSQLSNLIGAVFSLDQVEEMSELRQKLTTLTVQLQRLSDEQLHQFSLWVQRIFKWRLPFDAHRAIDELAASLQRQGGTNDMLTNFERVLDELIEQKMAEGEAKGIEKGMAKGIAKAKEDIAKEMLVTGMPLEQIMRLTKLSRERLEQLRKKRH